MPGIRAEATCRRLPDAWADDCPTCAHLRRWLAIRVTIGQRHVGEHLIQWCDHCGPDQENP